MSRRDEQRASAREKIMRAAAACFAAKGYSACSMQDIAAKADMSKGALYVYYSSKVELFKALIELQYKLAIDKAYQLEQGATSLNGIVWFMRECIRDCGFPMDHGLWAEIVAVIARDEKKLFVENDLGLRDIFREMLEQAADAGEIDAGLDMDATVLWLTSLANGLILRIADDPNFDFARHLPTFEKLVRRALRP